MRAEALVYRIVTKKARGRWDREWSNVESTFSMIKRKSGDSLRSKTDAAMVNETLCKILCHNLGALVHETTELGIDVSCCLMRFPWRSRPDFYPNKLLRVWLFIGAQLLRD